MNYVLTLTVSRIIFGFRIKSNILLFLQAVNNEIFNKLIILRKYRCENAVRVNINNVFV
jgi:hypothetical protein